LTITEREIDLSCCFSLSHHTDEKFRPCGGTVPAEDVLFLIYLCLALFHRQGRCGTSFHAGGVLTAVEPEADDVRRVYWRQKLHFGKFEDVGLADQLGKWFAVTWMNTPVLHDTVTGVASYRY
jgi:hypothetical protein